MSIDWTANPALAYLVTVTYTDADGAAATAYWAGPVSAVGSGIFHGGRSWQGRCSGATIQESCADPLIGVATVGSLGLVVAAGLDEDLMRDAMLGAWIDGTISVTAIDLDTKDTQPVWAGSIDSHPIWDGDGFRLSAESSLAGLRAQLLCTVAPQSASGWTKTTSYSGGVWTAANLQGPWYPENYYLHPELRGAVLGPIWGHGANGWDWDVAGNSHWRDELGAPQPGIWVEVFAYGEGAWIDGTPNTHSFVFLHVCKQTGVFVYDLIAVDGRWNPEDAAGAQAQDALTEGEQYPLRWSQFGDSLVTGINTDATAGPVGTFVRAEVYRDGAPEVDMWSVSYGQSTTTPRTRFFALVTGLNSAGDGGGNFNASTNPFLNSATGDGGNGINPWSWDGTPDPFGPDDPLTARDAVDEILTDLLTDTTITPAAVPMPTNAISDWWADAPAALTGDGLTRRMGRPPLAIDVEPPTLEDVAASLLATVGAALVPVYDAGNDRMAWQPVWLGPTAEQATGFTIQRGHLAGLPSSSMSGTAGLREAVTRVRVRGPARVVADFDADGAGRVRGGTGGLDYGAPLCSMVDRVAEAVAVSGSEGTARQERAVSLRHWHPFDPTPGSSTNGVNELAEVLLDYLTGTERSINLEAGPWLYEHGLGVVVAFDPRDFPALDGTRWQIRTRRLDLDRGAGSITLSDRGPWTA